jgi:hypothetical protein
MYRLRRQHLLPHTHTPHSHGFPPSQLLLTAAILAASAVVASVAAAKFWERHSSLQLLGLVSASPNPRCNKNSNSNNSSNSINNKYNKNVNFASRPQSTAFDFLDAARDFVWGMIAGASGAARATCFVCCGPHETCFKVLQLAWRSFSPHLARNGLAEVMAVLRRLQPNKFATNRKTVTNYHTDH